MSRQQSTSRSQSHPNLHLNAAPQPHTHQHHHHHHYKPRFVERAPADSAYGYVVAVAAAVLQFVSIGSINSFGVFFPPLLHEFPGLGTAGLALMVSVGNFITPLVGIVAGRWVDRRGFRVVVLLAAVCNCAAFLLSSFVRASWVFFITYGIIAGLGAGCSITPSLSAVGQWFDRKRSTAMGMAYAGTGLGGVVLPAVATYLLQAFNNDWRFVFRLFACPSVVLLACAVVIKRRVIRLVPAPHEQQSIALQMRSLAKTRGFRTLFLVGFFFSWGYFVPIIHIVLYAQDQGVSPTEAGLVLSALGLFTTFGNIGWGALADRTGIMPVFRICHAFSGVCLCLLPLCKNFATMLVFAVAAGFLNGGCVTCYPALAATYFPPDQMAAGIALIYTGFGLGSLIGPTVSGYLIDSLHSYYWAFEVGGAAFACALAVAATAPNPGVVGLMQLHEHSHGHSHGAKEAQHGGGVQMSSSMPLKSGGNVNVSDYGSIQGGRRHSNTQEIQLTASHSSVVAV